MGAAFISGLLSSLALIVAIGAQNAFVLRQGLARSHVLPVVLVCALSDLLLIALGVAGLGAAVQAAPAALAVARYGGALFLLVYGGAALRRAWRPSALVAGSGPLLSRRAAVLACLGFTYLNPHVWLDTVVLLGSLGAQQPAALRPWFVAGGALASFGWFVALGYGARLVAPLFARPAAWRVVDAAIAAVMWVLAASLLMT
jgi:L-lysine exporter family protein LysE/ArgO